jgi:hypothetical protein
MTIPHMARTKAALSEGEIVMLVVSHSRAGQKDHNQNQRRQ